MLSRLKGIETGRYRIQQGQSVRGFVYAFPFEGNWNILWDIKSLQDQPSLYMLSRLKGIETSYPSPPTVNALWASFVYAFPFEGNWKADAFWLGCWAFCLCICFPVWRELKQYSLETRITTFCVWSLCICFPVWRELKRICTMCLRLQGLILCICFPVWRELKHLCPPVAVHLGFYLCICFPVWRELKPQLVCNGFLLRGSFVYAFPFEGNWNITNCARFLSNSSLYMLSRLKGIETFFARLLGFRYALVFVYAFPFEGNWNLTQHRTLRFQWSFVYAFPFEGNWNWVGHKDS